MAAVSIRTFYRGIPPLQKVSESESPFRATLMRRIVRTGSGGAPPRFAVKAEKLCRPTKIAAASFSAAD